MRAFRVLITAAAAAVCMIFSCVTCFADEENYVVTTTTGTSAEGNNGVIWTQITQKSSVNMLDDNTVQLGLNVSNIEENKFTAALDVRTKQKIGYLSGSIGYNTDEFRLLGAQLAQGDTGVLTDEQNGGKYSFKYSNEAGTDRSGEYILLNFELIKENKKDDVLFLTVETLLDPQTNAINYNKSDGIIAPSSSPNISEDVKTVRLSAFARPYTFEEIGFADVINCEMEDSSVAKYSEGGIVAMTPGTVSAKLINKDYTIQKVKIEVYRADSTEEAAAAQTEKKTGSKAKTSVNIGVPVLLVAALVFAGYLVTNSPKNKRRPAAARASAHSGSYDPRGYNGSGRAADPRGSYDPRYQRRYPGTQRGPRR